MSYVIAGRAIKNEYLALGTFGLTGAITAISMSGGDKKAATRPTPITASSSEEESFIKDFVSKMESEAGKAKEAVKDAAKH